MILDELTALYDRFLTLFPGSIQPLVSLIIIIAVVLLVIDLVKRNFIWIILLILLLPASIPLLRSVLDGVLAFLNHAL
ncbi:hypothetical protein GYA49_06205 [Candidatus Beckwithbacteria bacterium]|nr:hypothetical protein [Candidatus Beckwithbacteria bacterium]